MKEYLQNLLKNAIKEIDTTHEISPQLLQKIRVDRTKDRSHGDFATNAAMMFSKNLHKKPIEVANALAEKLKTGDAISKIEIAGPGFINFFVNPEYVSEQLAKMDADPRLTVPQTPAPQNVVIDYSAPNVAKEMAVHHLRSTVIGDAVVRVLEFLGEHVIRANHIGDWGTQFGMLIAYLEKKENEQGQGMDLSDFEAFYREAKRCYDEDAEFAKKARHYVVLLQGGDDYCRRMWKKLVTMTMDQNQRLYDRLDVTLKPKDIMGESLYNDMLPGIVKDLQDKNIAVEDQGALVVYLPQFKNKDGQMLGNIVRKQDGGYLYTTTDIACIKYRVEKLHAGRIIYFTDSRQAQHMETVWAICRKAGYVDDSVSLEHCPFGMMLGKDGHPFKTRSGGTVKLRDLLDEAESRVRKLLDERGSTLEGAEREQVVHNIAVGAVKYADLSKNRNTDYIFDWDQMLSFDGNTAPYLQYAYSRIRAIFRKAQVQPGKVVISNADEETLAAKLLGFAEAVQAVGEKCLPNLLCNYLFELAEIYMHFYEACPILKDGVSDDIRRSRLTLCDLTAKVLRQGLSLLGINVMEQM
ncbi:MAG: arginine--tRNA ligase [Succinivibrio sp.]|jgi:arginyl-tRNA synthetase|nr:arginine--tRNA ligase [Succinivibrio sp.]